MKKSLLNPVSESEFSFSKARRDSHSSSESSYDSGGCSDLREAEDGAGGYKRVIIILGMILGSITILIQMPLLVASAWLMFIGYWTLFTVIMVLLWKIYNSILIIRHFLITQINYCVRSYIIISFIINSIVFIIAMIAFVLLIHQNHDGVPILMAFRYMLVSTAAVDFLFSFLLLYVCLLYHKNKKWNVY